MMVQQAKKPDVSICIVSYRAGPQLAECLRSLFQVVEGVCFEIVVVDNASADGTAEMVREAWPDIVLIENERNIGFPRAVNRAVAEARGRHVLLLNPDTVVSPGAVESLAVFLDGNAGAGAAGPAIFNEDGTLQTECRRRMPTLSTELFELAGLARLFPADRLFGRWRMPWLRPEVPSEIELASGACMMIRGSAMRDVGNLCEDSFMFLEDLDYCFRLREKGWKIYFCPDAAITHKGGQSSKDLLPMVRAMSCDARYKFFRMHRGARSAGLLRAMVVVAMTVRFAAYSLIILPTWGERRQRLRFSLAEFRHTLRWGLTLEEPGMGRD